MSTNLCSLPRTIAFLLLSIPPVAAVGGQQDEGEGKIDLSPLPDASTGETQVLADEMMKLFRRVERNMNGIDQMLNDASAGVVELAEVQDSGLDDLLLRTQSDSQAVVADIDKILELAQKSGSCSKCLKPGDGSCDKPGDGDPKDSPLDQKRDSATRDREKTPEQPTEADAPQRKQQGERPESPEASKGAGETLPGGNFNSQSGEQVPRPLDSDEWGVLPPKFQEVFRNEASSDVPVQYRDWIDAYYRRLGRSGR